MTILARTSCSRILLQLSLAKIRQISRQLFEQLFSFSTSLESFVYQHFSILPLHCFHLLEDLSVHANLCHEHYREHYLYINDLGERMEGYHIYAKLKTLAVFARYGFPKKRDALVSSDCGCIPFHSEGLVLRHRHLSITSILEIFGLSPKSVLLASFYQEKISTLHLMLHGVGMMVKES